MTSDKNVAEVTKPSRRVSRFSTPVENEELEFIQAIEKFKRDNGQPFPSWSEVLGIVKKLGYRKVADAENASTPED